MKNSMKVWSMLLMLLMLPMVMADFGSITGLVSSSDPTTIDTFVASTNFGGSNDIVTAAYRDTILNGSTLSADQLYPIDTDVLTVNEGILIVSFDRTQNAVLGITMTDLENQTISQRGYFIDIGNFNVAVDPLNSSNCLYDADDYVCQFNFTTSKEVSTSEYLYEDEFTTSATNHAREYTILYLAEIEYVPTNADLILDYYFTQSKLFFGMVQNIIEILYYFVLIALSVTGIGLIGLILKKLYDWIANGGKN